MDRRCRGWLWALGLLAVSACSEDAPIEKSLCPSPCTGPSPVLTGDGGAAVVGGGAVGGGGSNASDSGRPPVAVIDAATPSAFDAGTPTPGLDAGGALPDSSVAPRDGSISADTGVAPDGAVGGDASAGGSMLPPVTDYTKAGPFKPLKQTSTGPGNAYTIFRPDPLGENGFLHSPLVFGPGILTSGANDYNVFLNHLASHGYVVISVNSMGGGPGDPGNDSAMKMGLDWLIAQNSAAGPYQGKLAVKRAVTMGYSIGATSAVLIANHPAVITSVAIHGHEPMKTAKPNGPVLLLTGDGTTEIPEGPQAALQGITTVPTILGLYKGQWHITVISDQLAQGKPEFTLITAWLRYWVNGDDAAKRFFWGSDCTICTDSNWVVTKNAAWDAQKL